MSMEPYSNERFNRVAKIMNDVCKIYKTDHERMWALFGCLAVELNMTDEQRDALIDILRGSIK